VLVFLTPNSPHLLLDFFAPSWSPAFYSKLPADRGVFDGRPTLILLAERLSIGLAIWIKELFAAFLPCGLHFRRGDIPIWPALLGDGAEVLTEILKRRAAKEPIAVVYLAYDEARFQNNDMWNHRIVDWIRVFGNVEILLNDSSRIREERPVSADACAVLVRKRDIVGAYRD
jgi:hypothetical protein